MTATMLPAWWQALALEAGRGMANGQGPYWSGRFLCGQPLFGAPDLPFAGPGAVLLLPPAWGAALWLTLHALILCSGLALWLRRSAALDPAASAVLSLLLCACLLACPASAALLGAWAWFPWVVLLCGAATPGWIAAPFCALLISGAAPAAILSGFLFSAQASGFSRAWRRAWILALFLAGPLELELLRQAPDSACADHPGWPLAWLGGPMALFHAVLLLCLSLLCARAPKARRGLVLGLGAGVLALGSVLVQGPRALPAPQAGPYLRQQGRHQALPRTLPDTVEALDAERWTGAGGGSGPKDSIIRWLSLCDMGVRNPEALSLCDVAWVGAAASDGVRWYSPVQAAMVEGAVSENGPPRKVDDKIFDAPLRIRLDDLPKPPGTAWHLLNPKRGDPGSLEVALPPLMAAAWLFVSESMDPGWTAEVRTLKSTWMPAQLVASEGSFMAVHLEQPDAQVRLRYSPPGLGLGLMLALLGFLAFFATLFRSFAR